MARVFISHVSADLAVAGEVHCWLVEAGHEVFLDRDPHDGIQVGELWRHRLHERLRWADAVVCVVTSASMVSSWCTAEVATAQERGSRLLPLCAEPDIDHPLLTNIPYIDLAKDRVAARTVLIAALRRVDAAGGGGWPDARSPFPGLRPFEIDQHQVFFGRADETKALAELVRCAAGEAALVVGPSGCGKSSLVRAGLVPVLATEPGWRSLPPIVPGADPVAALAWELAMAARLNGLQWTVQQVQQRLGVDGLTLVVDELLSADPDCPQRLLLVVDQFEELLTQTAPSERGRFVGLLCPALTGPVQLVGTLRPEFLDQLLADPDLAMIPTRVYSLRPLHREVLHLVIEGPAQRAGINVASSLVARLVEDTGSGEALPLLAFTLAQLAEEVGQGGQLSATRYEQLGRVQGALTSQADAALAAAVAAGSRSREEVIGGLLRLVTVDEQGRPTRWRVRRDELPAALAVGLDAFVARRLLTTDTDDGAVVIGVTHEAFLGVWPPLAEAITANASALRARRAVEHAATEWDDHGRPPARLWGGGQLAAAVADTGARICPDRTSPPPPRRIRRRPRVLLTDRVHLSPPAREFLHTSIRRDRSRRRRATTVLSVLLVLALVAAGVAAVAQHIAKQRQRIATAGQLVGDVDATRGTDLHAALLLGLAAHHLHPDAETHNSLLNTLATGPYLATLTGHRGSVKSMAFTPDGHTLATASSDTTVILWDLRDPSRPHRLGAPLTGHRNMVESVAFAPDGRTLATGSGDATVLLWDVTDPAQPRQLGSPLTGHTSWVHSVAFAPDGRTLTTGSADGTVILWDLTDPVQPHQLGSPLTGHTRPVTAMAWTPDGRTLITGSADTILRWDLTNRAQPGRLGPPLALPTPLALSGPALFSVSTALTPDGRTLVTSGDESGDATLWDVTDPAQPRQLGSSLDNNLGSPINVSAFAPKGHRLATSSDIGTMLWDVTDPTQPQPRGPPLTGHHSRVNDVAFSPDGRTLVVGSDDGTAILWNMTDPVQPQRLGLPLTGHDNQVWSVTFAPDGRTLATGGDDGTLILWDVTDPARSRRLGPPLTSHRNKLLSVTFAPDGRTLATASVDGVATLWDVTHPAQPRALGPPLTGHSPVILMTFAPDGRTLATVGVDGAIILWDVTDLAQPRQLGPPLTGHTGFVRSVVFTPDGRTLATGSLLDGTVILWDVTDPAQSHQLGPPLTGHTGPLTSMAFAPNGHTLATGSLDGTVILRDLTDPAQPHRLSSPVPNKGLGVWSVAFAPDGRTLAVSSTNTTLWDLADPDEPLQVGPPLPSYNRSVLSVAFAPDGRTLATGDAEGAVILWDLTDLNQLRDHTVERACATTHGGLNRDEWTDYIPALPYQDTCPG